MSKRSLSSSDMTLQHCAAPATLVALSQEVAGAWDEGIEHAHEWARGSVGIGGAFPIVADAGRVPTPSSVLHDDALYMVA